MKRKNLPGPSGEDLEKTANPDQETTTNSGSKRKLGRRGFLKLGAGATAAALVTPVESIVAQQRTRGSHSGAALQGAVQGECNVNEFYEPKPVWVQPNNVLETTLNAEGFQWTYTCPGDPTKYTGLQPVFNSAVPGPTLYVNPGSTLNITLNNKLNNMPKFKNEDKNCPANHHLDPPKPACYQHTNLHFHGFQVSPCSLDMNGELHCGPIEINAKNKLKCSSDDVLVDIAPGYSNQYCVVLPDMHAPGTNWYHSHLHGASAYQVSGGMSGAIIIREPKDSQIVREDLDKVFVLQEVLLNPKDFSTVETPPVYGTPGQAPPDTQVFVNGICRPTLTMQSGQMNRWRFVNTGPTPRGLMTLKLVKSTTCTGTVPDPVPTGEVMFLIAIDGLSFYGVNPQPVRYHLMGPGSRADFLVKLEPGIYTLLKDAFPLESVTKPDSTNYTNASSGSKEVLAYIEVVDSKGAYDDKIPNIIPGKKPDYLKAIWTVDCVREAPIKFQNPGGQRFQIDGAYYDPDKTPIQVKLNTAEEWTLQNIAGPVPQSNTHPFHVHLNPFQILGVPFDFEVTDADRKKYFPTVEKMDPKNPDTWPFWDTVPLPGAASPDADKCPQCTPPPVTNLKIRSRFLIYDGEYVTHCHILIHEDVGMMVNVKLIGDGIGPNEAVHDYPPAARACIDRTSKPSSIAPKPCPSPSPTPTPTPKH